MFFKTATRPHPQTGAPAIYYRLVENCRNALGEVRQRNILTVGFMEDVSTEELHRIADGLNERVAGQQALFTDTPKVSQYIDSLYARLVNEKRIDRLLDVRSRNAAGDWHTVDLNTFQNRDVRELGAEWLCLQVLYRLQVDRYLQDRGWSVKDRDLALAHIVSRTIYPASELKTVRFMHENSSVAELLDLDASKITKDHLYRISHKLFAEKEGLEQHLSHKTNELFDLQDKIILYDLTNTYFEGEMRTSHIAKRGRSKGGVKKYDKVNRRIGRLQQKYPSVHRMYRVELQKDSKDTCTGMTWELIPEASVEKQDSYGVYFLRTSLVDKPQDMIWTIYNCIREIENSFRTLKTDLDLRPIFHKTDDASQAHLHLGMLAYWVVNTVRHQLKASGITSDWRELVRMMNTQKCVTTTMINDRNEHISIRCCSQPSQKVALVYDTLKLKPAPFIRKKSVVRKIDPDTNRKIDLQKDTG